MEIMDKSQCAICLEGVYFSYNNTPVLADVNLHIPTGQLAAVVGPNGGGKTTLLKLILGLLSPTKGTIRVLGESPARVRHKIGYMPQYAHVDLKFPITVQEVVQMGLLNSEKEMSTSKAAKDIINKVLENVMMVGTNHTPFSSLSGGQKQRILLARALAANPEILLLDEPTANVDNEVENKLGEILHKLKKKMTILMVSHDIGFVSQVVETVVCVNRQVVIHPVNRLTGAMISGYYGDDLNMVRHDHRCVIPGHTHTTESSQK